MARRLFGGGTADWTFDLGDPATAGSGAVGNLAVVIPAVEVTFYDSLTGGSRYSDLTDLSGSPASSISSDASGEWPLFYGPDDDIREMYADASGGAGPRRLVTCVDLATEVKGLAEQVANLQNTVDNLTAICALMVVANVEASGSYADRPALAGARLVLWVGDDTPSGGGTPGMAEGDIYADTAP